MSIDTELRDAAENVVRSLHLRDFIKQDVRQSIIDHIRPLLAKRDEEIEALKKLIEGEIYQKEPFGPLMKCRYCYGVKGNGHATDCDIGLVLMESEDKEKP